MDRDVRGCLISMSPAMVVSGVVFFFVRSRTPLEAFLIGWIAAMIATFVYINSRMDQDIEKWSAEAFITVLFMSGLGTIWSFAALSVLFGSPSPDRF